MNSVSGEDFFGTAAELVARGERFATVTVVRAERPTSGKPGDKAIVTENGEMVGFVGGSCAEPAVVEEALEAIATGEPRFVRLSPSPGRAPVSEGIKELRMTCFSGGTMDFYIEPQAPAARLVVVGTTPVADTLNRLGEAMGYRVTQLNPRALANESGRQLFGPDVLGPASFVVVATHGTYDEEALAELLGRVGGGEGVAYVGLVASRKRAEVVRRRLMKRGIEAPLVERIRSPAGLDFGARRPQEIALSILAETVQLRSARETSPGEPQREAAVGGDGAKPFAAADSEGDGGSCCGH